MRCFDEIGALCNRRLIAVDADDPAIGSGKNVARITAGAERPVDDEAAVADAEKLDHAADEHGNVTGQSASGIRLPGAAARRHSRAPSGSVPVLREAARAARKVAVAFARCVRKRCGSQI